MSKIFLSYRRQDAAGIAGRIYDRLRAHFGNDAVFMDIDNIPFGVDFRVHLDAAVGKCDVVLVVIGTKWIGETNAHRRLDDPRDFVRIEIESALHRDVPVIPVLIDHARMPAEAELPASLARLTYRNAIEVDQGRDFHPHVDRLIKGIEFHFQRANIRAAPDSSQPRKPATSPPNAKEDDRGRHKSPSSSAQRSKADPRGADGSKSKLTPKPSNISWLWFCVAALSLLAFLGIIIYINPKPSLTEQGGMKKAASPNLSVTGGSKPASTTTKVQSPTPKSPSPQPAREWTNSIGIKLVRIEPGEFLMGSTNAQIDKLSKQLQLLKRESFDDEQPQHPVKITRPFYLAVHPVTVEQFRRFVESAGYKSEAKNVTEVTNWRNPGFAQGDDHPVVCVSHNDAVAFLAWLNEQQKEKNRGYRLPTEAEREYACRAGTVGLYGGDDDPESLVRIANVADASFKKVYPTASRIRGDDGFVYTAPVGSFEPNAWHLYDMLGNVWEWCDDWYDPKFYQSSPGANPHNTATASSRVFRGGSWGSYAGYCRPAHRDRYSPEIGHSNLGFRVAAVQE